MLTIICGPSCAGKTEIQKELGRMGYKELISYTTRPKRLNEENGVDYHFCSLEDFQDKIKADAFAEYEEYSQNRFYGLLKQDVHDAILSNDKYAVVVTPNGMRSIKSMSAALTLDSSLLSVFFTASLGQRVKRYIDRCGDEFNFDDMNEINARVNRDYGMFLNIEKQVDLIFDNSLDAYTNPYGLGAISKIAEQIDKEVGRMQRNTQREREWEQER